MLITELDPRWVYMPASEKPRGNPPRFPEVGEPIGVRHIDGYWVRNYFAGFQPNGTPLTSRKLPMGAGRFALSGGYGNANGGWLFRAELPGLWGDYAAQVSLPIVCADHGLTPGERYRPVIVREDPNA